MWWGLLTNENHIWRYVEVHRGMQRYMEVCGGVYRGTQRYVEGCAEILTCYTHDRWLIFSEL